MVKFWKVLLSVLLTAALCCVLTSSSSRQRGSKHSHHSYKGTNPFHEGSTLLISSNPNYLPKSNLLILPHWGIGFQDKNFAEGTNTQSITQMKSEGRLLEEFLLLGGGQSFVLFRASTFSTHATEVNLLYREFINLNVDLIHRHPHRNIQNHV